MMLLFVLLCNFVYEVRILNDHFQGRCDHCIKHPEVWELKILKKMTATAGVEGKGEDERACEGTRPPPRPEPSRRPAFGSGGGRFGALQRGPIGSGHHFGPRHSAQTGPSLGREQQWVEKPSKEPEQGRREPIHNSLARRRRQIGGPCCRSGVDVGQTKLPSSCVLWRGPKRRVLRSPPKAKWHTHGIGDGGNFWHAQLRSRSRTRCWSTRRQPLPAAQHPQRLM